ncbi:MAG: ribonuclease HIII, partial [candidate division Zixibacteria bacterium]|nr:ribonuclease HIII [candidate division Zixibacteria bacterium]
MSDIINNLESGRILGIDESGKGDFFGPLVIAGVLANETDVIRLRDNGVRDSKKITDKKILELSNWITENFVHTLVVIGPEKYNQLYQKIKNLNKLLAWGHSRVIENIVLEHEVDLAISDKFGRADFIESALMEKGKNIKVHQMIRGEAIIQVAAASIVARAAFVKFIAGMKRQFDANIPKGA